MQNALSESAVEAKDIIKPVGYKILIAMPEPTEKIGSIHIPQDAAYRENTASITGYVLAVGPDAYRDNERFPAGPLCKEGDHVIFRSYSGTRFKVGKREFRMINDDTVEAVVSDPSKVERAV